MRVAARSTLNSLISNLRSHSKEQGQTLSKLSSSKRVEKAADDAASLSLSKRLDAHILSQRQAIRNANDGISFVQTAEGGLSEMSNVLTRLRELSVQSGSDTVGETERGFLDTEFQSLKEEVDRIAEVTSFNGTNVINGDGKGILEFHVGANAGSENIIKFDTDENYADTNELGIAGAGVADKEEALENIEAIDSALNKIAEKRSSLGATQSRLSHAQNNLETNVINHEATRSKLEDADMAHEAAKLASQKLLTSGSAKALAEGINNSKEVYRLIS